MDFHHIAPQEYTSQKPTSPSRPPSTTSELDAEYLIVESFSSRINTPPRSPVRSTFEKRGAIDGSILPNYFEASSSLDLAGDHTTNALESERTTELTKLAEQFFGDQKTHFSSHQVGKLLFRSVILLLNCEKKTYCEVRQELLQCNAEEGETPLKALAQWIAQLKLLNDSAVEDASYHLVTPEAFFLEHKNAAQVELKAKHHQMRRDAASLLQSIPPPQHIARDPLPAEDSSEDLNLLGHEISYFDEGEVTNKGLFTVTFLGLALLHFGLSSYLKKER